MNNTVINIIQHWRAYRNRKMLMAPYSARYAFVGVGGHALQNLYPVLQYLGIQLKYICCKSADKLPMIEHRFGVTATTSLDAILNDDEVKGVFVCTSPQSHYSICLRLAESGKHVFVEKPPCRTCQQLQTLTAADGNKKTMVGMQKRYSPAVRTLKKRLDNAVPLNYTLIYHTGAYPEGNPVTELFIHPVDLAIFLFGTPEIKGCQRTDRNGTATVQLLLSHNGINGFIELSTAYSWALPEERLCINTAHGEYRLDNTEQLCHYPHPKNIIGIPLDKIGLFTLSEKILSARDSFSPLVFNNQLYTQGFLSEIKAFADMVEHSGRNGSSLHSMADTYNVLSIIDSRNQAR